MEEKYTLYYEIDKKITELNKIVKKYQKETNDFEKRLNEVIHNKKRSEENNVNKK